MATETKISPAYSNVAVLIPCYNEALTIKGVVRDFAEKFPYAGIYVGDNNSTDGTREEALSTRMCRVIDCPAQGKGAALRAMLEAVDANYYILADGDATYMAKDAGLLLEKVKSGEYGMAAGDRLSGSYGGQKLTHAFGNHLVDRLINAKYRTKCVRDAMSGLRVFNKNVADKFKSESRYDGFEVEVELVTWCLRNDIRICSVSCGYAHRPAGSKSKLNTVRDGIRILRAIIKAKKGR